MEPEQTPAPETTETKKDPSQSRKALVKSWLDKIKEAEECPKIKVPFDRMKMCQRIAADGSSEPTWVAANSYVEPVINRHINLAVAQLYAKDPTVVVKRKPRMLYKVWDEKPETATAALQAVQAGDITQLPVLQDIIAGQQYMMLLDRMARTMEIAWTYFMSEQKHNYKDQLKAAVRRTKVNGVAYAKLGFQRVLEENPEATAGIADVTSKIKDVEALIAANESPDIDADSKKVEELRLKLADLEAQQTLLVREGPILSFPKSNTILFDPDTVQLKTWAGTKWVAEIMDKTPEEIKKTWGVDIGKKFKVYTEGDQKKPKKQARCYEVWDIVAQMKLVVCDGYDDFIVEPRTPDVLLERFNPFFPLIFNEVESDEHLIPPSDVWQTRHPQDEINRSGEGLRGHRKANVPFYGMATGAIPEKDKTKLGNHAPHEVVEMNLPPGADINQVVKKFEHTAIDPAQYDTTGHMNAIMRVVGTQEANMGPTSGATATETSIAENSRASSTADNIDDLDGWLSDIAKAGGHLMLLNLTKQTIEEIVGPGAAWPDMPQSRKEIAKDLSLEIEAGSSGRPNNAAELANMERAAPTILQLPNINPEPFAKKYLKLLNIDTTEGFVQGLPSITALNAMISKMVATPQPGTGDPATDPAAQGGEGQNNAPQPAGNEPQAQPQFPAPGTGNAPMANAV